MKMEKLSLGGIRSALSRAELKTIMAGSGGGGGSITCCQCGIGCPGTDKINYQCFQGADTNNCSTYCAQNGYPIGYPDCPLNCWSQGGC